MHIQHALIDFWAWLWVNTKLFQILEKGSADSLLTLYPQVGAAFAPYRKFTYSGLFWRDRPRPWYFLASVAYSEKANITNNLKYKVLFILKFSDCGAITPNFLFIYYCCLNTIREKNYWKINHCDMYNTSVRFENIELTEKAIGFGLGFDWESVTNRAI